MKWSLNMVGPMLGLLLVLLTSGAASGNPVAVYIPGEIARAVDGVMSSEGGEADSLFIDLLQGEYASYVSEEVWQLLDEEFNRFAPLFTKAELPPDAISNEFREWFWDRADDQQREAMVEAMRAWLTAPRVMRERPDITDERGRETQRLMAMEYRVDAAERLVDYADELALTPITALRDSLAESFGGLDEMPVMWVELWWYLHQAALRLETPDRAVLCRPSSGGSLEFVANPQDITVARYVRLFSTGHPEMPVDRNTARRVVALVEQATVTGDCRDRGRAPCSNDDQGMMISVADGREMTLSYDRDGTIVCSDNTRYYRWAYKLTEPALLSVLQDIDAAFVAEKGHYPID